MYPAKLIATVISFGALACHASTAKERVDAPVSDYVGQASCATCHADQAQRWAPSDHARAMQHADKRSVLGNFNDVDFASGTTRARFFERDGRYFVRIAGPDGQPHDYAIEYTFGADPLQQYLVTFERGRLQALTIAWDARPRSQGGQRWFDLYEGQDLQPGAALHWTGRDQNWNFMCASCHSTRLERNYDLAQDSYETRWSELNVACEACHGPGAKHVAWARAGSAPSVADRGLARSFDANRTGGWALTADARIARWVGPKRSNSELEACAPCHTRSRPLTDKPDLSQPFLDNFLPAGLEDAQLYHPDGQILGEVFEYGSFLQSKMHNAGVTCSDCHDPHSTQLKRPAGNTTCTQCHRASTFEAPEHHHHDAATSCIDCHMPERTYMQVDARRDHSFRVPRPELTGSPNVCASCHASEPESFVRDAMTRWYGDKPRRAPSHAPAIAAGRAGSASASAQLTRIASDSTRPAIVRAAALSLLSEQASISQAALTSAVTDPQALVRVAAARTLTALPPLQATKLGAPLLADPLRAVRVEAARSLASLTPPAAAKQGEPDSAEVYAVPRLERAIAELIASELASAERPEAHLNLSSIYLSLGKHDAARAELQTALRLHPRFTPALVALAELERIQQHDAASEQLLQRALALDPSAAPAHHALGLLHARTGDLQHAREQLGEAARLQPEAAGYAHSYALVLQETGDPEAARSVLNDALRFHPADRALLEALNHLDRTHPRAE